jgi:diguanylate cyclase (GGDEF)-like protein
MKIIKSLVPVLVFLIFSFYGFYQYSLLPQSILNAVIFLPVVLSLLVVGLAFHFSRSHVFFYALLVITTNVVLGMEWAGSRIAYAMLSMLVPLLLVLLTLFPDRGVLTRRALPMHLALAVALVFASAMVNFQPGWLTHLLLTDWLPARYFDWTGQPQTIVYVSVAAMLAMLIVYATRPSTQTSAGLGVLILLIAQLHFGGSDRSLHVFSSIALLMCLYAVLQESWRMAYLDELTELPGRRALREKLQKIGGSYAVAMLDVDHFKKFNDNYGHDAGDAVLRMIAAQLRKVTGGGAAFRYGGEEFTIVFNGKSCEQAVPHLEALRESIATTPFVINRASRRSSERSATMKPARRREVQVTVSAGVADSDPGAGSSWDILKLADKALYRAKKKGRNCVSE